VSGLFSPTLAQQIACVTREIGMRRTVYARRVAEKKMTQHKAEDEIAAMEAVKSTLDAVKHHGLEALCCGTDL